MLLNYLQGFYSPTDLVIVSIVMIFALMVHNVTQAWVASKYGDASPRFAGFLNLDPQQHLEPMGVALLFILGFGWPKQVPVNSRNYSGRGRSEALVWYSGPLAYLAVAFACVVIGFVFATLGSPPLFRSFGLAASVAILHAVINLFPVFPLDGAKAALAWGNADVRRLVQQIASFGLLGFIIVFMLLGALGITSGLQRFFFNLFVNIVASIAGLFGL